MVVVVVVVVVVVGGATDVITACKGKRLGTCYSTAYETRTAAIYNLGSGS